MDPTWTERESENRVKLRRKLDRIGRPPRNRVQLTRDITGETKYILYTYPTVTLRGRLYNFNTKLNINNTGGSCDKESRFELEALK